MHVGIVLLRPTRLRVGHLGHDHEVAGPLGGFSVSLIAENRRRLAHMEGALRRLDETTAVLGRRMHAARQEEITQEIEVIMLSAQALAEEVSARAAL